MPRGQSEEAIIAVMANDIATVKRDVKTTNDLLSNTYVTKDQHELTKDRLARIEKIVYTFLGVVLLAVLGAVMTIILNVGAQ